MKRSLVGLFVLALSLGGFAHAQCVAFPCVVASVSLTNQSKPIPATSIYTPPVSGLFRISAYLSLARSHTQNQYWDVLLRWTDDNGMMQAASGHTTERSSNAFMATAVVQDLGGEPIRYKTTPGGEARGQSYNLFITVEQLQ
jgi:hypothetical protein